MSRWEPGARSRLESAALELFAQHGFAATTVPQITAHAGLTTRTFFRHFADKREVLFWGENEIPKRIAAYFAQAPAELSSLALISTGLEDFAEQQFAGQHEYLRRRRSVVRTDESLLERELLKQHDLGTAVYGGFLARGLDPLDARVTADVSMSVFHIAIDRWLDDPVEHPLRDRVREALGSLRGFVAEDAADQG